MQSSGLRGAANQQRSLLGWRKDIADVRPACTGVLSAVSQALRSSAGYGANSIVQAVGAGTSTRAMRALKEGV